jgi:hypothetical protein
VRQLVRPGRLVGLVFVAFGIETQRLEHLGRESAKRAHPHTPFTSGDDSAGRREELVPATPNSAVRDLDAVVSC